jgi:hypothetical protein
MNGLHRKKKSSPRTTVVTNSVSFSAFISLACKVCIYWWYRLRRNAEYALMKIINNRDIAGNSK